MPKLSATVTKEFYLNRPYEIGDRFIAPDGYPDVHFVDLWVQDFIARDFDESLLNEQARGLLEFPELKQMRLNQLRCPQCNPRI